MTSLFQVIAHEDANDQGKLRQAMALAHQRVEDRFGAFVRKGSVDDQVARYSLVEDDVKAVVAAACSQVGFADVDGVLSSIGRNFVTADVAPQLRTASVRHEARKPKMCPYHSEVTDISLAAGDPAAGFNSMQSHAWTDKHCQGEGYKGDKCKFKPAMTTQAYWDERSEKLEQKRQERAEREQQLQEQQENVTELPEFGPDNDTPADFEEPQSETPADTLHDGFEGGEPVAETSEVIPMAMAASTKRAYGEESTCPECGAIMFDGICSNSKCPRSHPKNSKVATETTGLGGPETPIDKRKWTPKTAPLPDTEDDNSRWPTRRKDVTQPIAEEQGSRFDPSKVSEIGEKTTERQDVTQKGGIDRPADQGGTWTKGEKSAVSKTADALMPEYEEGQYNRDNLNTLMQQPPDPHADPNSQGQGDGLSYRQRQKLMRVLYDLGVDPNQVLTQMDQSDLGANLPQMASSLLDQNSIKQAISKFKRA